MKVHKKQNVLMFGISKMQSINTSCCLLTCGDRYLRSSAVVMVTSFALWVQWLLNCMKPDLCASNRHCNGLLCQSTNFIGLCYHPPELHTHTIYSLPIFDSLAVLCARLGAKRCKISRDIAQVYSSRGSTSELCLASHKVSITADWDPIGPLKSEIDSAVPTRS